MEFDLLYMEPAAREQTLRAKDLIRDLKLQILLDAMSGGDKSVYEACAAVLSNPLVHVSSIRLRSEAVRDAVKNGEAFESLWTAAREALEHAQKYADYVKPKYDKVISNSNKIVNETEIARIFIQGLQKLKPLLDRYRRNFQAEGLLHLCDAVQDTLSDEYLLRIQARIEEVSALKQGGGVSVSARIGEGLKQADAVLNRFLGPEKKTRSSPAARGVAIPLNGITLIQNAQELAEKALAPVFAVIAGFNRSVRRFLERLDFQMKFFVGCIRLHRRIASLQVPVCYPEFVEGQRHAASLLVDAGLALQEGSVPVGNDACFSKKRQVIITGPNQGGKTTFLRSVGLAQLMAQCGMYVCAGQYICPAYTGIFTHIPNGEDSRMQMGLLEVELSKLSGLVDALKPGALLLMNESFQTTTPAAAKRLAAQIIPALVEAGVLVVFVTHLYGYAMGVYEHQTGDISFLKAQRDPEGSNTYRMLEGPPFKSAYGLTLLRQVMGETP